MNKKYKIVKHDYSEYKQKHERSNQLNSLAKEREKNSKSFSRSISPSYHKINTSNLKAYNNINASLFKNNLAKKLNNVKDRTFENSTEEIRGSRSKSNKRNEKNDKTEKNENSEDKNNGNLENLWKLAEDLEDFFKLMTDLQKAISEKNPKIREMKYSFEDKKQELISLTNIILKSKQSNNLLLKSDTNIKYYKDNFTNNFKDNFNNMSSLIPKPKIKTPTNQSQSNNNNYINTVNLTNTSKIKNLESLEFSTSEKKKLEDESKFILKLIYITLLIFSRQTKRRKRKNT